jgi:hypothetical protein
MRGLRRAYDPHQAERRCHQLLPSRLVWVWGSTPPFGGGQVGNRPHLRGAALGAQWERTLLSPGGLSRELHASPASAGNVFGCGSRVLGVVRVRGRGWFGEAPERPVYFVVLLPVLHAGRAHHRSKGRRQGSSFPHNLALIYP